MGLVSRQTTGNGASDSGLLSQTPTSGCFYCSSTLNNNLSPLSLLSLWCSGAGRLPHILFPFVFIHGSL